MNDEFYDEIINKIDELARNKIIISEKERIEKIFKIGLSDEHDFYREISGNYKLFQNIIQSKTEHLIFDLPNRSIYSLESFIHNNITRISNAGAVSYDEKPAIEQIINFIESNMNKYSDKLNHLRTIRLGELVAEMKLAVKHLENTHNKN